MTKPWARTELHFGKFTNILGNDRQHKLENILDEILDHQREELHHVLSDYTDVFDQD